MLSTWKAQGLNVLWITLLLDDPNEGPPTEVGALQWKQTYNLGDSAVFPDSNFSFVPGNSVGTPQMTVINPRTMEVVFLEEGYSMNYSAIESVANENKALWGN